MAEEFPTVSVKQGTLRGRRRLTASGSAFLSFEGVPYAKPPLGALRFKAPQPPESWPGIRDAIKVGNQSFHYDILNKKILGDEDSLFLNIYTPGLPSDSKNISLRPVMVYIHGGGFNDGCGHVHNPEPFMEKDVVAVNFNYRLGPLGFLGLGTLDAPGNAGLKDQRMALRWVKENIEVFGGDSNNVTIFGESAGGASVHYQLLSPSTKGLFQRVIAQSGSALCPWAFTRDPVGRAKRLALAAGCDSATANAPSALAQWFLEAPAEALVRAVDATFTLEEKRHGDILAFVPCAEPTHADAFLTQEPAAALAGGEVPTLPIVFGMTTHEGILWLPEVLLQMNSFRMPPDDVEVTPETMTAHQVKTLAELDVHPEWLLPKDLRARCDAQRVLELGAKLKEFFFNGQQISEDTLMGLVDVYSDTMFSLGLLRAARDHARQGAQVHLYEFACSGRVNFLSQLLQCKVKGVCHADELTYLFNMPLGPQPESGSPEALTRERLVRLWANFAKSGNPTPSLDSVITTTWPSFSESAPNYLKISEELIADIRIFNERMLFWKDLYSK